MDSNLGKKGSEMDDEKTLSHSNSIHGNLDMPDFFLYTTLNQNQTKDLRKARTNREERKVLESIFGLKAIKKQPNDEVNKVDQILLDFHCINYNFCSQNQYSNEKVSTLLAIMDFLLHAMIKHHMMIEDGIKLLKQILEKHSR